MKMHLSHTRWMDGMEDDERFLWGGFTTGLDVNMI